MDTKEIIKKVNFNELKTYDSILVTMPFSKVSKMYIINAKNSESILLIETKNKRNRWKVSRDYLNHHLEMFEEVEPVKKSKERKK